ncbi:hypothetical protein SAMN05443572_10468 [Myxococcus fulvus]|uniref:Uncharacterized protein n=1 Tax=Myxococcus fulvus TaxID=33 RepID=A0ABY1CDJ0_MYXFU|nr:hypothetical protein SAMN05443572_10468 [Myxococcus fulvus]
MSRQDLAKRAPHAGPTSEDVRLQLEGRAEVLESAHARTSVLESALRSRAWKRKLRAKPTLVEEWLEQQPRVVEALEHAKRRAEREAWPESLPLMRVLRELDACSKRLAPLVRRRLSRHAFVSGPIALATELRRLDTLAKQRVSQTLEEGEVLLFQTQRSGSVPVRQTPLRWSSLALALLGVSALIYFLPVDGRPVGGWLLMALLVVPMVMMLLRSGWLTLTSERLMWSPVFGEAVSVPLSSIAQGGVQVSKLYSLKVDGMPGVTVPYLVESNLVATLLELHTQAPLRGLARSGVRLENAVLYPATLREDGQGRSGWAVLRPGGVSFVPNGQGPQALATVLGRPSAIQAEVNWVLDSLRWLPDSELDGVLARVVEATGGVSWSAWETSRRGDVPLWKRLTLSHGHRVLSGQVEWSSLGATEKVLGFWPEGGGHPK